ncbi:hypothetical protein G6F62_015646 [Rhizopus arrhizus]|nr:hypothetical protein G6F62_015646 [Rhizopus arrhizus]
MAEQISGIEAQGRAICIEELIRPAGHPATGFSQAQFAVDHRRGRHHLIVHLADTGFAVQHQIVAALPGVAADAAERRGREGAHVHFLGPHPATGWVGDPQR